MKVRMTLEMEIENYPPVIEGIDLDIPFTPHEVADILDDMFSLIHPFETDRLTMHIKSRRLEWLP